MAQIFTRTNNNTARQTLNFYWQEMRGNKRLVLGYATLIPIANLIYTVLIPLFFSLIIQSLITHPQDLTIPMWLIVASVVGSLVSLLVNYYSFLWLFNHEEQIRTALTRQAFDSLLAHSYQFYSNKKIGSLAGDFNGFTSGIVGLLDTVFLQANGILVNFIASLVIISFLSPILLVPLGLLTIMLIVLSFGAFKRRAPIRHQRKLLTSQLNGTVADILGNHMLVKVFARDEQEGITINAERLKIETLANREVRIIQREAVLRLATLYSFQIITIVICIWLFTLHMASIAALIFAVTYLGRVTSSLFNITGIIRGLEQVFLDAAPLTDILSEKIGVCDKEGAKVLIVNDGAISCTNMSFAYQDAGENSVISNLTLSIPAGQRVGLAGPSGGGKSTLIKLLLRFADVQKGIIEIDGQDIKAITQESLRSNIAYVPQEPLLFHRTLQENIAYGRPNASDEEIIRATKQAYAMEFIDKLPEGLDTVVGERGVKLSGGQRQRIAIARAILKDAPILLLDEATSALDSESEVYIQKALEKLMQNRTTIVIAHRLSTIQKMNRVIVLNNGQIEEDGTHAELLANKKLYAKLWAHQSGGFIED